MGKSLAIILYNIFLLGLLFSQVYLLIFTNNPCFDKVIHYILSVYLIFRLYMFGRLNKQAAALDLTLTEFLHERDKYVGKKQCD